MFNGLDSKNTFIVIIVPFTILHILYSIVVTESFVLLIHFGFREAITRLPSIGLWMHVAYRRRVSFRRLYSHYSSMRVCK